VKHNIHIAQSDAHGHTILVYSAREERLRALAEYFREGLANGELCIFVAPEPPEEIIEGLLLAGLDVNEAVAQNKLRLFEMNKTYLPHGAFVSNYMVTNVINFLIDAKTRGFTGVRTAGEMAWLYDHPEFLPDAMQYEDQINELSSENPDFIGLCMYPVRAGAEKVLERAMHVHPDILPTSSAKDLQASQAQV
jgi:hypothetical protein